MTTILDSEYIPPERPYSQVELNQNRQKLYKSLHLSDKTACHEKCQHFYFVKQNGRKEKDIIENNCNDVGNCSVCWKISKSTDRKRATNLVNQYTDQFYNEPEYTSYDLCDVEYTYYHWLYDGN